MFPQGKPACASTVAMIRFALLLLTPVALWGCDTTIDVPPSQRGAYTLWGALDPTADVQAVRVVAVADTLVPTSPAPLPVRVVSTDLATGAETPWRDSLVAFRNGSVGHVYRARFRPAYGGRYRFAVRQTTDGRETSATMTIPPRVEPRFGPVNTTDGARVTAFWPGAEQVNRIRVTYVVQRPAECDTVAVTVRLTPTSGTSGQADGGWAVVLNLSGGAGAVYALALEKYADRDGRYPNPDGFFLGLRRIVVSGDVATAEWRPPGNVFDFEALAAPEVFDNVTGGFGFVGGSYRTRLSVDPNPFDLRRTRYVDTSSCGGL